MGMACATINAMSLLRDCGKENKRLATVATVTVSHRPESLRVRHEPSEAHAIMPSASKEPVKSSHPPASSEMENWGPEESAGFQEVPRNHVSAPPNSILGDSGAPGGRDKATAVCSLPPANSRAAGLSPVATAGRRLQRLTPSPPRACLGRLHGRLPPQPACSGFPSTQAGSGHTRDSKMFDCPTRGTRSRPPSTATLNSGPSRCGDSITVTLHPAGARGPLAGESRWVQRGWAAKHRAKVTVKGKMMEPAPTSDPDEDGQAKADEEDDEHEDEVALGERVQPHGCQPAGRGRGEGQAGPRELPATPAAHTPARGHPSPPVSPHRRSRPTPRPCDPPD